MTTEHYFPHLTQYFKDVDDFRQQSKVEYPAELMLWMGVIQRLIGVKSNNEYEKILNISTEIEDNILKLSGVSGDELPSIDDFCYFLQKLPPEELHKIRRKMLVALERKKFLSKLKTKDGYLLLAIDGVQTISTKREFSHSTYCDSKDGTRTYHQYFLEAKIVSSNGFVLSIDTEFIENPTEKFDKQDCELKAAKRLLERIAREHPHLSFWILGDALYCNSVIMDIGKSHKWKYSFTFKGESKYPKLLGEINAELNFKQRYNTSRHLLKKTSHTELYIELRWCNGVNYNLGENGEREINYLEGKVIRIKNGVEKAITTFTYLLSEYTDDKTALKTFMNCRHRWKIENEGFNFQKNNILNIGHSFSSIGHAGQNFYLLAQIAHTIIQLAYFSDIAGRVRRATTGEQDNLSQTLQSIFRSFMAVAERIRVELFDKVFKPPLITDMRIRLKFA